MMFEMIHALRKPSKTIRGYPFLTKDFPKERSCDPAQDRDVCIPRMNVAPVDRTGGMVESLQYVIAKISNLLAMLLDDLREEKTHKVRPVPIRRTHLT